MRIITPSIIIWLILLVSSCATIPPESVELSDAVGEGLAKQHEAQVELVNIYFTSRRQELDDALLKALNRYFREITPSGEITLTVEQLSDVADDVLELNNHNNENKEELENVRVLLINEIDENYMILHNANDSITRLLESAVNVHQARSKALRSVSGAAGGIDNLDKIFSEIDRHVAESTGDITRALKIVEDVKEILYGNDEEKEMEDE